MKIEKFQLDYGDKNVFVVYMPDKLEGTYPVMIHGSGWNCCRKPDTYDDPLINSLLERGTLTVTIDFYGKGETGGDYNQMTFDRWMRNLNDVYDWIDKQEWSDSSNIGIWGGSTGSVSALRFAIEYPDKPAYVISCATAIGFLFEMPNGPAKKMMENLDTLMDGGRVQVFGHHFGLDFFKDTLAHQPVYRLKEITCPVFFMEGSEDNPFRRADGWLGYQILKKKGHPVRYIEIEGGDHGLNNVAPERNKIMKEFLEEFGFLSKEG